MEKMLKKLKVLIIILLVVFISIIAFWGVFKKENGVWNNLLPEYHLGIDVQGARELRYHLDDTEEEKYVYVDENGNVISEVWEDGSSTTAEHEAEHEAGTAEDEHEIEDIPYTKETRTIKVNPDEKLTKENFEQAKKIIQKRLKNQEVSEYNMRLDDVTGNLVIETKNDNAYVSDVGDMVLSQGKFQIIDYQNGLVLLDNSDIERVSVVTSNDSGYKTYLQVQFNKEGSQKLRDISTKYVRTTQESEEESEQESEENSTTKYVAVVLDGTTMLQTYFGEEMTAGILQIAVGDNRTEYNEYLEDYESASVISNVLNSGMLPVSYKLEADHFVQSEMIDYVDTIKVLAFVTMILVSIILIVKFKKNGALASVAGIGYIALLLIIIRYTNAIITESAIFVYYIVILLNYIFLKQLLKRLQTEDIKKSYFETAKRFYLNLIPAFIVAIIFTLTNYFVLSSIGMAIFWGLILNIIYHFIVTKNVFTK